MIRTRTAWLALVAIACLLTTVRPTGLSWGQDEKAAAEQAAKEKQVMAQFERGVELFNQGKYAEARQAFTGVKESGVELGFFRTREMNNYLQKIDEQMKPGAAPPAAAAGAPKTGPPAKAEAPKAGAPAKAAPREDFGALYDKGVGLFAAGKYPEAKAAFQRVKESGTSLGFLKNRRLARYLVEVDQKIAEAAKAAAAPPAKPAPPPVTKPLAEAPKPTPPAPKPVAEAPKPTPPVVKPVAEAPKPTPPVTKPVAEAPKPTPPVAKTEAKPTDEAVKANTALYNKGVELYGQGKYPEALDAFTKVKKSGVSLGWWNNRKLEGYLKSLPADIQRSEMARATEASRKTREAEDKKLEEERQRKRKEVAEKGAAAVQPQAAEPTYYDLRKRAARAEAPGAPSAQPVSQAAGQDSRAKSFMQELTRERQLMDQRNRALAEHHADMGRKYYDEANYPKAKEELEKALKLAPDAPQAREVYDKTLAMLGVPENKVKDFAQKVTEERSVKIEQKQLQMENRLREGVRLLKTEQYDEAIQAFQDVKTDLEFLRHDIDVAPYADHLESLLELAAKRKGDAEKALTKRRKNDAARQAAEDETKQKEVSEEKLKTLYEEAYNAFVRRQFKEVNRVCGEILQLDPNNAAAEELKQQTRLQQDKKTWEDIRKKDVEEHGRNRQFIADLKLARPDTMTFPEKDAWEEITRRDPVSYPEEKQPTDKEAQLKDVLKNRRVDINFEATPLADVVGFLKTLTDVNIVLDPNLESDVKEKLITLTLSDVTLGAALDFVVGKDLIHTIKNDAIFITTKEALRGELSIQVYDVRDLLLNLIDRPSQPVTVAEAGAGTSAAGGGGGLDFGEGGGGGGGGGAFGTARSSFGRDIQDIDLQRRGHDLIELIVRVSGPQNWDHAFVIGKIPNADYLAGGEGEAAIEQIAGVGGGEGGGAGVRTIAFDSGDLIVRQTTELHDEIKLLLSRMRESLYLQVAIDARFLQVQDDWFEEVGTDITNLLVRSDGKSILNSENIFSSGNQGTGYQMRTTYTAAVAGGQPAMPIPNNATSYTGAFIPQSFPANRFLTTATSQDGNWNTISPLSTSNLTAISNPFDATGATQPFTDTSVAALSNMVTGWGSSNGLNLGMAFLSNLQAALLIKAVQDSRKGEVLYSPRLTVFNTQRANIAVGRRYAYVVDYDTGNQGVPDPSVGTITTSTTLDVRPIVSADRRYVYLELCPSVKALDPVMPFREVTLVSTTRVGNILFPISLNIELPQQDVKIVETTVCVPDQGHLLIGGMADVQEKEGEAGVPVLDKIPLIKRLFSRHGTVKQRIHLLILVHPTIVAKEELENKAN